MCTFAERLTALRDENGLTMRDLADDFGVSVMTVSKWEKGKQVPQFSTFERLAEYFDVDLDYLNGADRPEEGEEKPEVDRSEELTNLMRLCARLSPASFESAKEAIYNAYRKDRDEGTLNREAG